MAERRGEEWKKKAIEALLDVCVGVETEDTSESILALAAIRDVFTERERKGEDSDDWKKISSAELTKTLASDESAIWRRTTKASQYHKHRLPGW